MSKQFDKLVILLKELFQLDQPDLDFGLYRIMHAKAGEITQFLEKDLLPQVREAFSQYKPADKAALEDQLKRAIEQANNLGVDPDSTARVKELRQKIANESVDVAALETEVYDHLYSFFRRYYDEGDFLAKRVYKPGVYAIPYEGEEVALHWANRDQYYIKTSEYLRDYVFTLRPSAIKEPMRVHFRLVDAAEGEHGNVKAAEGRDRVFILAADDFIGVEDGELVLRFHYRPATMNDWHESLRQGATAAAAKKPPAQKELLADAVRSILAVTDPALKAWIEELSKKHVRADGETAEHSRLEGHLNRYVARHTFDYFIHKDLGGFLRRELDFFIKNEIMHLDDVESESAARVDQYLSKIKVIRRIAHKLITFLAQIEDFQKKLWLKKKFVVETAYCITLDRIPREFYEEITANDAQRAEWVSLFGIDAITGDQLGEVAYSDPLSIAFLEANPFLSLNTDLFDEAFKHRLLSQYADIDAEITGTCIGAENFAALSLINARYANTVDSVYIDPPYNTDAAPIIYKNGYRHSSWLALVDDRIQAAKSLLNDTGIWCITIDDAEVHALRNLMQSARADLDFLGVAAIKNNPAGRTATVGFSVCHEYALFYGTEGNSVVGRLEHSDEQKARYKESDDIGAFEWTNFRKHGGGNTYRTQRPRQFYPIYVHGDEIRLPAMEWDEASRSWKILEKPAPSEEVLLPIDSKGRERIWDFVVDTAKANLAHLKVRTDSEGKTAVYRKWRINDEGLLPQTWWDKSTYSAVEYGTNLLTHLFGQTHMFTFPKSVHAVRDCLIVAGAKRNSEALVLDYFAGSGTTGHAVMDLNRMDEGRRKFILVEMGPYLDTVLVPRLRKVAFSSGWRDGRPTTRTGTSAMFKVLKLESFEDALNSLDLRRSRQQQTLLEASEAANLKEEYLLRYMLDVETRGSQSLLNIAAFRDPTAYLQKVKVAGSDQGREVNVDLLETFNYLIGLTVQHVAAPQTFQAAFKRDGEKRLLLDGRLKQDDAGPWWFRTVQGVTPDGRKALVIWRKLTGDAEQDNLVLDAWFTTQGYSTKDYEFDLIFVNGDNNLENLRQGDELWKVRLIEEDFHRLMFDIESV